MTEDTPTIAPFAIKPQDKLAIRVISYWLREAAQEGVNAKKINAALMHLAKIAQWQADNPDKVKTPD